MSDGFSIVMPFVVVESNGGPYDDAAYVAGFEAGRLHASLWFMERRGDPNDYEAVVHAPNLPQVDLIAMEHGWKVRVDGEDEGWATVTLQRGERSS